MNYYNKICLLLFVLFFVLLISTSNAQIVSTYAGTDTFGTQGDGGVAIDAKLYLPLGLSFDNYGNLLLSQRILVRKVNKTTNIIESIAGSDTASSFGGWGDGRIAITARVVEAYDVCVDVFGNYYISDYWTQTVRKVNVITGIINKFAGTTALAGSSGDGGLAVDAKIQVGSIEIDRSNNYLYNFGCWERKVRRINMHTGIIETFAGTGATGYEGDGGPATAAKFGRILGGAIDKYGNVYIGDWDNHRIRKVSVEHGRVITVVGNGIEGYSGDGEPAISASITKPASICFDTCGNMYFSDEDNNRVRKVDYETGIITTVAGNGIPGFSGDGGLAINAQFNHPTGVCIDNDFNFYVGDYYNHRIRKIALTSSCIDSNVAVKDVYNIEFNFFSIYPNPTNGAVTVEGKDIEKVAVCNVVGQVVYEQAYKKADKVTVNISHLPPGVYVVRVNDVWVGKVVKE